MAKVTVDIGEKEKHHLVVNFSIFSKRITIEMDGKKVVDKGHYSPAPEKFQFDVGSSEQHRVEVSAGGFSPIIVSVDGNQLKT